MIRVDVEGDSLDGFAEELMGELEVGLTAAAEAGAAILERAIHKELGNTADSEPGQPPTRRSGRLQRSWKAMKAKLTGRMARARVSTDEPDAARHEFGGKDSRGIYLPARPYLRRAEKAAEAEIEETVAEILGVSS